jgi:hypothetical protein
MLLGAAHAPIPSNALSTLVSGMPNITGNSLNHTRKAAGEERKLRRGHLTEARKPATP